MIGRGRDVLGVSAPSATPNFQPLEEAGNRVSRATWSAATGLTGAFPPASFDAVVLDRVLAHTNDPTALLQSVGELLRPHGCVVLTAFNARHGSHRLALLAGGSHSPAHVNRSHEAMRSFDVESLVDTVVDAGFRVEELLATVADPLDVGRCSVHALPPSIVEWVRDQPDAYDHELIISARPSSEPLAKTAIRVQRTAAPESVRRRDDNTRCVLAERNEISDLRHRLLTVRDHIIGLEAETSASRKRADLAELRAKRAAARVERLREKSTKAVRRMRRAQARARKAERRVRLTRRRLNGELEAMRRSRSFRAGRALTAPLRVLGRKG